MFEEAGTRRYQDLLSSREDLRAVAGWAMREGLLHQFSLAKEQADRAEAGQEEQATTGRVGATVKLGYNDSG